MSKIWGLTKAKGCTVASVSRIECVGKKRKGKQEKTVWDCAVVCVA